jgi:acyl-CoA synthetase (AMP-forming)/AMP-acid ligase II
MLLAVRPTPFNHLCRADLWPLADLGNEKATAETFDSNGLVHTGDECRFDDAGWLYVVDRIKE